MLVADGSIISERWRFLPFMSLVSQPDCLESSGVGLFLLRSRSVSDKIHFEFILAKCASNQSEEGRVLVQTGHIRAENDRRQASQSSHPALNFIPMSLFVPLFLSVQIDSLNPLLLSKRQVLLDSVGGMLKTLDDAFKPGLCYDPRY